MKKSIQDLKFHYKSSEGSETYQIMLSCPSIPKKRIDQFKLIFSEYHETIFQLYVDNKLKDEVIFFGYYSQPKKKGFMESKKKIDSSKRYLEEDKYEDWSKNPILSCNLNRKEKLKVYRVNKYNVKFSFFINDQIVYKEKSFNRSWKWRDPKPSRELISKEKFIRKKGFMESKETLTVSQDNDSGWRRLGFGLCFIIFVGYKFFSGSSKEYKPFFCNYVDGVLNNPNLLDKDNPLKINDPCEEGQSKYKKYINNEFSNEKECNIFIEDYGNTKDMKITYPSEKWMIGCDKKW